MIFSHSGFFYVFTRYFYIIYMNSFYMKNLLNQIIEHEEERDEKEGREWISKGKGENTVGESLTVFHLKTLKKLLEDEEETK